MFPSNSFLFLRVLKLCLLGLFAALNQTTRLLMVSKYRVGGRRNDIDDDIAKSTLTLKISHIYFRSSAFVHVRAWRRVRQSNIWDEVSDVWRYIFLDQLESGVRSTLSFHKRHIEKSRVLNFFNQIKSICLNNNLIAFQFLIQNIIISRINYLSSIETS